MPVSVGPSSVPYIPKSGLAGILPGNWKAIVYQTRLYLANPSLSEDLLCQIVKQLIAYSKAEETGFKVWKDITALIGDGKAPQTEPFLRSLEAEFDELASVHVLAAT